MCFIKKSIFIYLFTMPIVLAQNNLTPQIAIIENMYKELLFDEPEVDIINKYADQELISALKNFNTLDDDFLVDNYPDIMVSGQDYDIKSFQVLFNKQGDTFASFTNFGKLELIPIKIKCHKNNCVVTDINNVKDYLIRTFKQAYTAPAYTESFGIPNIWTSGWGQGWAEYNINNDKQQLLRISCNVSANEESDHNITVNINGNEYSPTQPNISMAFVIDGNAYYPLHMETHNRNGANAWYKFTQAIGKGKKIEVYLNNEVVALFTPTLESVNKVAKDIANCDAMTDYKY